MVHFARLGWTAPSGRRSLGGRCHLVVVAIGTGGRGGTEAVSFIESSASARQREELPTMQRSEFLAWRKRWTRMLAVSAARAFAASLISTTEVWEGVDGAITGLADVVGVWDGFPRAGSWLTAPSFTFISPKKKSHHGSSAFFLSEKKNGYVLHVHCDRDGNWKLFSPCPLPSCFLLLAISLCFYSFVSAPDTVLFVSGLKLGSRDLEIQKFLRHDF